jgi:hypothetical protein
MRVLFLVFVVSVLALIWAAIAVTRHIRHHEAVRERPDPGMPSQAPEDSLPLSQKSSDSQ